VLERLHVGADEETDEEPTTRSEHTSELIERTINRVGLVVDQRVPRQDPFVTIGRTLEGVNVPEGERHIRVCLSCVLDEFRNLIDPSCFTALLPEEGGPMARAATSVEQRTVDRRRPRRDEVQVGWMHARHRAQLLDVLGGST
jgi:hypothetical protein